MDLISCPGRVDDDLATDKEDQITIDHMLHELLERCIIVMMLTASNTRQVFLEMCSTSFKTPMQSTAHTTDPLEKTEKDGQGVKRCPESV